MPQPVAALLLPPSHRRTPLVPSSFSSLATTAGRLAVQRHHDPEPPRQRLRVCRLHHATGAPSTLSASAPTASSTPPRRRATPPSWDAFAAATSARRHQEAAASSLHHRAIHLDEPTPWRRLLPWTATPSALFLATELHRKLEQQASPCSSSPTLCLATAVSSSVTTPSRSSATASTSSSSPELLPCRR